VPTLESLVRDESPRPREHVGIATEDPEHPRPLADELRAATRRAVAADTADAAGPPAMVRQLESRVLLSATPAAAGDGSSTDGSTMPDAGALLTMVGADALVDADGPSTQDSAASDGQSALRRELLLSMRAWRTIRS